MLVELNENINFRRRLLFFKPVIAPGSTATVNIFFYESLLTPISFGSAVSQLFLQSFTRGKKTILEGLGLNKGTLAPQVTSLIIAPRAC